MSAEIGILQAETLRSQVEKALRDAIMGGTFPPGSRLVERDLCERLGVSRTSVREALRKLEAEKLVRNVPHKGPVVAVISASEAAELYAIRGLLEGFAAREFARLADSSAIVSFGAAVKELRVQALAQNKEGVLRAKTQLYDVLLDHCGNSLIKEALIGLYSRINLLRTTSLMHPDRLPASLREIEKLHKLIKARDEDGAELAARTHVANARDAALRVLAEASADAPARAA
ncbi:GntR family transcriptional regulator [Cupriavidus sp. 8B]